MEYDSDGLERFEEEWRRWATRPTGRGPQAAARDVAAAVSRRRERRRLRRVVLAAAAAVLIVVPLAVHQSSRLPLDPEAVPASLGESPAPAGQVLIWLDEKTPLYMTFQAPEGAERNGGRW